MNEVRVDDDAPDHFRRALDPQIVEAGEACWRWVCAGRRPDCVLQPRDEQELAEALRRAVGYALIPCGNGTHLDIGSPPSRYDAALSVRHLDRVVAHDAGDMTVTVEAGATLEEVNRVVGEAGQWLPFDPAGMEEVTVGGLIAADRNGPMRLRYGKIRDYLLGARVLAADGSTWRTGGRVVKNVAGYDLGKLLVGSYGTLGVVTEATFRLVPRPALRRVFFAPMPSLAEAVFRALALRDHLAQPLLMEAINDAAAEEIGVTDRPALIVACAGSPAQVDAERARLEAHVPGLEQVHDDEQEALLRALRSFPQPLSEDALVARVSVLPTRLGSLLQRFQEEAGARGLVLEIAAHAGIGVAWCQVAGPRSLLDFELCCEWMRMQAHTAGGWVVFESLPAGLFGRVDPWGFHEPTVRLMAGIKRALDPAGTLSPGRFVGGI